MILFPAIDIKDGKVVRLTQGDYNQVTEYNENPVKHASEWAKKGTRWLHIVDLDAAKAGAPVNRDIIAAIAKTSGLKVQVGGGIRSLEMAADYLESGVSRVIVGTRAVEDPLFLGELSENFPGQVALGLDTKDGKIAVQGWTESTDLTVQEFLNEAPLKNIACLIFTDIAKDGMLQGPNLKALKAVLEISPIPVIASGGISQIKDLQDLRVLNHHNLLGVIVGKALYEGCFTLEEAIEAIEAASREK